MDLKRFYAATRQNEQDLAEKFPDRTSVFLTSLETETGAKAGVVTEVDLPNAARFLALNTHTLSTDEEIAAHSDFQKSESQRIAKAELERKQPINLTVTSGDKPKAKRDE